MTCGSGTTYAGIPRCIQAFRAFWSAEVGSGDLRLNKTRLLLSREET